MRRIAALVCAGIVVSAGCLAVNRPSGTMVLYDDQAKMHDEVVHYIPIGTRVEQAKAVMLANGFHCDKSTVMESNGPHYNESSLSNESEAQLTFTAAKPDPDAKPRDRYSLVDHEVEVTMICRGGRVIDVKCYAYPTH